MSFAPFTWVLHNIGGWTWFVAEYRGWVILGFAVLGLLMPVLTAFRKHIPSPTPSLMIRSGAMGLGFAAAAVTACSLLHFTDLRWLKPGQRGAVHLSAPGGIFGFAKPIVGVVNTVANVPAELRAIETSVNVAIGYTFIALGALVLVALTARRARRADIRQVVREELRRAETTAGSGAKASSRS